MIATLFSSRMRALPCVLAVSTARRRARASRPPSEKLDAARDGVGISGDADAQAAARAAGARRAARARAALPAHAAPRPARVPEGPRRPARRAGGGRDRRAPGVRGGARPLLHRARVRDARGALRPRDSPRPRPRGARAGRGPLRRAHADRLRPPRAAPLRRRPIQQPQPVPRQRRRHALAPAAEERLPALHPADARAGDALARRALRVGEGPRRRLQRRRPRAAHGPPHHLSPVASQGGPDRARHAREAVRAARAGRAGRRLRAARQRAGVGALRARSAPRRHLHRPPRRAHARGLLRRARIRRQPPARRLEDGGGRGRRPAARLLDLLAREGRLRRAPRPSHVDAQPGRGGRTAPDHARRGKGAGHDHRPDRDLRARLSMARHRRDVLGNRGLARFDFCIIGSGAGGGTAAHVLTAAGQNVLVLEAGPNPFPGLDDPSGLPLPLHSNDELKYSIRNFVGQDGFLEPRTFRGDAARAAAVNEDVNVLPKAVGGAFQHADAKTPRLNAVDFRLKSTMDALIAATPGLEVPGFNVEPANFADWPFTYAELERFYVEAEQLYGVQGRQGDNIFESARSQPYPMPPGVPMYFALLLAEGARQPLPDYGPLHPHTYPAAINSRFYDGRPPCVDCGLCSGFGCPNNSKGSPAVTTLRRALLTGRCQLRFNAQACRLVNDGGHVSAAEYIDGAGIRQRVTADAFVLAASPIESARLCLLSPTPGGAVLGNSSGQRGQTLLFP